MVGELASWLTKAETDGLREESLFLDCDGLRIHAVLTTRGPTAGKSGAVLVHGFRSEASELAGLAGALARHGWTALGLDLRGCGASGGDPDDVNGYAHDARAGVDYLLGRAGCDRVFLVGHSLGAAVAITSAAADARVAGVVALHPSCEHDLGAYEPAVGHGDVRRPSESVAGLIPRPLLIIAGQSDPVLPCSKARDLYEAARAPKRMIEIIDGTHAVEDSEAYALGWLLAGAPHV